MRIPASLDFWHEVPGGADWLARLPRLVAECADEWGLEMGEPLTGGNVSLVLRVSAQGEPAVLKVSFPEPESEHEAAALARWDGVGAVRLLEHDHDRHALLVEWCEPGMRLWDVEDDAEATAIAATVLHRLRRSPSPGDPFEPLSAVAARWTQELPRDWEAAGRPVDRAVLDEAAIACHELGVDGVAPVLLHQDLNGGNVLLSPRGWLAIDPKPLVGDPAFDAASLLRDRRWLLGRGDDLARVRGRLDLLTEALELDRERLRLWGVVHALAWGLGSTIEAGMIRCAELLHRA